MGLKEVINKTGRPVTKDELVKGFQQLKINESDLLMVYSCLENFDFIIGGAQTVIDAIYEVAGYHTTIVMPSHKINQTCPSFFDLNLNPEWEEEMKKHMPAYDLTLSSIDSDELARTFAMSKNIVRSSHPVASFIATGRKADWYLNQHALTSMFGERSPLQKLYAQEAKLLCLGVDYENITALHFAEYFANCRDQIKHEAVIMKNGKRQLIEFEDLALDSSVFNELGLSYEKEVEVPKCMIGGALCRLVDFKSVIDFGAKYLK